MREFKFRAWDESRRKMCKSIDVGWIVCSGRLFAENYNQSGVVQKLTIMQSTGLNDKNGVEIFELDVVKNIHGDTQLIKWLDKEACFCAEDIPIIDDDDRLFNIESTDEVIGNVFTNPELLELDN